MANSKGTSPFYFPQSSSFAAAIRPSRSFLCVLLIVTAALAARALVLRIDRAIAGRILREETGLHIEWLAPARK